MECSYVSRICCGPNFVCFSTFKLEAISTFVKEIFATKVGTCCSFPCTELALSSYIALRTYTSAENFTARIWFGLTWFFVLCPKLKVSLKGSRFESPVGIQREPNNGVDIVTWAKGWAFRVWFPEDTDFFLQKRPGRFWDPSSRLFSGYSQLYFVRLKRPGHET